MRRALILAPVAAAAVAAAVLAAVLGPVPAAALASPATAWPATAWPAPQDGRAVGLRYLTWPGKRDLRPALAAAAVPADAVPAPVTASRPAAPAPRPAAVADGSAQRQGLTPASTWLAPAAPVSAHAAPPSPAEAQPAPSPQPVWTPPPRPAPPPPAAPALAPADPNAPRPDAPIFRLQRDQPARPAAAGERSRYYSLHRPVGRQPDAVPIPEPVYLEGLPVDLDETPRSADLAEPPAAPNLVRDALGRLRPMPGAEADPLP